MSELQSIVGELATADYSSNTPAHAFPVIVDRLSQACGATTARAYLLNLVDSRFDCVHAFGASDKKHIEFDLLGVESASNAAAASISSGEVQHWQMDHGYPIKRGAQVVGGIFLHSASLSPADDGLITQICALMSRLYEEHRTFRLFEEISRPVYVDPDSAKFFSELVLEARLASGMRFVALRELSDTGRVLACVAQDGFDINTSLKDFDLVPVSAHPTFANAIQSREPVVVRNLGRENVSGTIFAGPAFRKVATYVVFPVLVSDKVIGTISFAAPIEYELSVLELAGLKAITNSVGVAMSNYRNMLDQEDQSIRRLQMAVIWNTVDVAQAVRHIVRRCVDNCLNLIGDVEAGWGGAKITSDNFDNFAELRSQFAEILRNMDHLRNITAPPDQSLSEVALKQQWEAAFEMVKGRAPADKSKQVKFFVNGDYVGRYKAELLKHVFVNLILNSQDAFAHTNRAGLERRIEVYIDDMGPAANRIKMRYTDNAGGISFNQLKYNRQRIDPGMDIFSGGVTSKPQGSGWGLYLVRRFLQENGGSIDLRDSSGSSGVTFELWLPRTRPEK